ncbi:MAG TPA: NUDIX domain-containing protein [Haloplasmataceae bacterium]
MSKYKSEEEFLKDYDVTKYDRPSVSVDTLVFTIVDRKPQNYRKLPEKVLRALLIKRNDYPYKDKWALPGGFVKMDEDLETAALRELKEETNVDVDDVYIEQLYTYGDVHRDPRTRVISCAYLALTNASNLNIKPGDDAGDAMWFDVTSKLIEENRTIHDGGYILKKKYRLLLENEHHRFENIIQVTIERIGKHPRIRQEVLSSPDLAFDHAEIIHYGLERLRNKIEYTDIAFNLIGDYFTLTELQQVYEVILGKELLKANFRRKIANMVCETNRFKKDVGHRPSRLYRFNPYWADDHQGRD